MSRYFFHVRTSTLIADPDGTELPDVAAAHDEAVICALEIIADGAKAQESRQHWSIEVADERGETIFVLPFASALTPQAPASLAA